MGDDSKILGMSKKEYFSKYHKNNYFRISTNLPKKFQDDFLELCEMLQVKPAAFGKYATILLMEKIHEDLDNNVSIGEIKHRYGISD